MGCKFLYLLVMCLFLFPARARGCMTSPPSVTEGRIAPCTSLVECQVVCDNGELLTAVCQGGRWEVPDCAPQSSHAKWFRRFDNMLQRMRVVGIQSTSSEESPSLCEQAKVAFATGSTLTINPGTNIPHTTSHEWDCFDDTITTVEVDSPSLTGELRWKHLPSGLTSLEIRNTGLHVIELEGIPHTVSEVVIVDNPKLTTLYSGTLPRGIKLVLYNNNLTSTFGICPGEEDTLYDLRHNPHLTGEIYRGNSLTEPTDGFIEGTKVRVGDETMCTLPCGNGVVEPKHKETCDDGNIEERDGCSSWCREEPDYICVVPPESSTSVCFKEVERTRLAFWPQVVNVTGGEELAVGEVVSRGTQLDIHVELSVDVSTTLLTTADNITVDVELRRNSQVVMQSFSAAHFACDDVCGGTIEASFHPPPLSTVEVVVSVNGTEDSWWSVFDVVVIERGLCGLPCEGNQVCAWNGQQPQCVFPQPVCKTNVDNLLNVTGNGTAPQAFTASVSVQQQTDAPLEVAIGCSILRNTSFSYNETRNDTTSVVHRVLPVDIGVELVVRVDGSPIDVSHCDLLLDRVYCEAIFLGMVLRMLDIVTSTGLLDVQAAYPATSCDLAGCRLDDDEYCELVEDPNYPTPQPKCRQIPQVEGMEQKEIIVTSELQLVELGTSAVITELKIRIQVTLSIDALFRLEVDGRKYPVRNVVGDIYETYSIYQVSPTFYVKFPHGFQNTTMIVFMNKAPGCGDNDTCCLKQGTYGEVIHKCHGNSLSCCASCSDYSLCVEQRSFCRDGSNTTTTHCVNKRITPTQSDVTLFNAHPGLVAQQYFSHQTSALVLDSDMTTHIPMFHTVFPTGVSVFVEFQYHRDTIEDFRTETTMQIAVWSGKLSTRPQPPDYYNRYNLFGIGIQKGATDKLVIWVPGELEPMEEPMPSSYRHCAVTNMVMLCTYSITESCPSGYSVECRVNEVKPTFEVCVPPLTPSNATDRSMSVGVNFPKDGQVFSVQFVGDGPLTPDERVAKMKTNQRTFTDSCVLEKLNNESVQPPPSGVSSSIEPSPPTPPPTTPPPTTPPPTTPPPTTPPPTTPPPTTPPPTTPPPTTPPLMGPPISSPNTPSNKQKGSLLSPGLIVAAVAGPIALICSLGMLVVLVVMCQLRKKVCKYRPVACIPMQPDLPVVDNLPPTPVDPSPQRMWPNEQDATYSPDTGHQGPSNVDEHNITGIGNPTEPCGLPDAPPPPNCEPHLSGHRFPLPPGNIEPPNPMDWLQRVPLLPNTCLNPVARLEFEDPSEGGPPTDNASTVVQELGFTNSPTPAQRQATNSVDEGAHCDIFLPQPRLPARMPSCSSSRRHVNMAHKGIA